MPTPSLIPSFEDIQRATSTHLLEQYHQQLREHSRAAQARQAELACNRSDTVAEQRRQIEHTLSECSQKMSSITKKIATLQNDLPPSTP